MEMMSAIRGGRAADRDSKSPSEKEETSPATMNQRMKKKKKRNSSSSATKKPRPRSKGLGVAELERIILMDNWKKLTESNHFEVPPRSIHHNNQFPPSFPFVKPQDYLNLSDGSHSHSDDPLLNSYLLAHGAFSDDTGTPAERYLRDLIKFFAAETWINHRNQHLNDAREEILAFSHTCDICKWKANHFVEPRNYPEATLKVDPNLNPSLGLGTEEKQKDIDGNVNPAAFTASAVTADSTNSLDLTLKL